MKLDNIRFIGVFLALFVSANLIYAQPKELQIKHLSVEDGLSQSTVFSALQDSKGFMWFGTRTGGLNKYDGYSFIAYKNDPEDSCSITGNEIISLFEDSKGNIWAGTRNFGLNRFDANTACFHHYFNSEQDTNVVINYITEDAKGQVWVATHQGLFKHDAKEDKFVNFISGNVTNVCAVADSGYLWLGRKNGLYLFDTETKKILRRYVTDKNNTQSLPDNHITSMFIDTQNRLWLGTRKKGISRLVDVEKGIFINYQHDSKNKNSLVNNIIRTLHQDKKGVIWVGTKNGLDELVPEEQEKQNPKFVHYQHISSNKTKSLSQNSIYSFCEDVYGDFWVGTWSGGVNHIKNSNPKFKHITHKVYNKNSLSNNKVSAFISDKDGLWIGTEDGGLNFWNRKTDQFTHYECDENNSTGLNSNHIKSLLIDSEDNFWIGTFKGLHLFDRQKKTFQLYLQDESIYSIMEGEGNDLWIGASNRLHKLDTKTLTFKSYEPDINDVNALYSNTINVTFKDKNNEIWIGTKRGLHRYDAQKDVFVRYLHSARNENTPSNNHITSICADKEGNLWFGTYDGLNKYDLNTKLFTYYTEKIGLPDNSINSMLVDESGILWLTTNKGLTRFNPIPDKNGNFEIRNYDKLDGLQENEFTKGATYKNDQGELFFGGLNGFNSFHPADIQDNSNIPEVAITNLKLFNRSVGIKDKNSPLTQHISMTKELELNYKQSVFTLEFVALNYLLPEKNQYAYFLEGFDNEWNYVGNKREATYTNLPAGEYIFRVKASNNDGIWNETGISLKIKILPPWWNTKFFKGLVTISIIIIILSFYFYRISTLKAQKKKLKTKVEERTLELKSAFSELEQKQEEILQQSEEIHQRNEEVQRQAEQLKETNFSLELQKSEIEKSYKDSQILSDFGQKLTATFNTDNIHEMVYEYLKSLMSISAFGIGIYNDQTQAIDFYHFIQEDKQISWFDRKLDNKNSLVSWSFNHQEAVYVNDWEMEYQKYVSEKPKYSTARPPLSNIHIPLSVDTKKIGVIAVNSFERNAYSENDFTHVKTIASYLAIALDNANAYLEIDSKNYHIESSIRYAKTIQQVILPPKPRIDSFYQSFITFRPKDIVSGDFYWVVPVSDTCFIIAVVDCTGHGVPGAFMSIIGTNLLDQIVKGKKIYEPNEILSLLDRKIKVFLKQNDGHNDDGMDVCLCKIDRTEEQYQVTFGGAKRPLYYSQNDEIISIKGTNKSIGGRSKRKVDFEQHKLLLESGDMLYLTSDGYIDQCDSNRKKFGKIRFQKMLQNAVSKPLVKQQEIIEQELDIYQEQGEQRDDITVLGIKL